MYTFKIQLQKEDEGGYMATIPSLPGCITYGETLEEALDMAKEAAELYLDELQQRGEVIRDDSNTLEYSLNLQVL